MVASNSAVAFLPMSLWRKRDGPDYCTEEGARLLKQKIESYWRERGCDVTIGVYEMGFHPAVRANRFELRSDMINGAPRHICRDEHGPCSRAGSSMADFVIVYFNRGSHVSSSPWSGHLEAAKKIARDGLVSRSADEFKIRSDTLDGPLVWQEQRDS